MARTKAEARRLSTGSDDGQEAFHADRGGDLVSVEVGIERKEGDDLGSVEVDIQSEEDEDATGEDEVAAGEEEDEVSGGEEEEKVTYGEEEDEVASSEEEEGSNGEEEEDGRAENDASDFVDEPPMCHDKMADTSDDETYDDARPSGRVGDGQLYVEQAFYSGDEFKQAILEYALRTGSNIEQERWEQNRLAFKCGMGGSFKCGWKVYCSYDEPANKWLIKSLCLTHVCIPNSKCKILKSPAIARLFLDKLRINEDLMPRAIQESIKEQWKLSATNNQCQKARLLALKWIQTEYEEQYAYLRGYQEEIKKTNPGSTCEIVTFQNAQGDDVFDKFYVCFDILRSTWIRTCRRFIGVDGCFLRTVQKGVLLSAIGIDSNNQIYPLAWAVVQSENTDSWVWFIKMLKVDLGLQDGNGFIIISDRQKGLISAIRQEVPNIEHRWCVKHIYENLKTRFGKIQLLKPLVWSLAWSYNKTEFDENLDKVMNCNQSLHNAIVKEDPKTWSRAFFKLGNCCENVDNNFTESFNASIVKARDKAMVPMLETIRRQAMVRIAKRNKRANNHRGMFTPYVSDVLELHRGDASKCVTFPGTHGLQEVHLFGNSYTVNLRRHKCTCCKWEITGIPCVHALGAIRNLQLNVDEYISVFYLTSCWRETYTTSIIPVRGPRFWMRYTTTIITPPPVPNLPGRKKEKKLNKKQKQHQKQRKKTYKRIKGKNESPSKKTQKKEILSRAGRIMHCSKCRQPGHNAIGCGKRKHDGASSSQGPPKRTLLQLSQDTQLSVVDSLSQA